MYESSFYIHLRLVSFDNLDPLLQRLLLSVTGLVISDWWMQADV